MLATAERCVCVPGAGLGHQWGRAADMMVWDGCRMGWDPPPPKKLHLHGSSSESQPMDTDIPGSDNEPMVVDPPFGGSSSIMEQQAL